MSVAEMKIEVINKITAVNDESVLKEVLAILQLKSSNSTFNLTSNYDAVKEQYGDVLQKLAQ